MLKETTKVHRIIMAVVAVIVGFYLIRVAPVQAMETLKIALDNVMTRLIPFDPDFYPAVPILGATYGIWIILLVLVGSLSLVLVKKIYDGAEWARATLTGAFAIPAVAGMTMFIPWMVLVVSDYSNGPVAGILPPPENISTAPPVLMVMVVGLLAYFVFLLSDKDTIKNKILKLIPYTFIGVVAGMVFMNAQHGVRYFIFIPEYLTETSSLSQLGNFFTNLDHYDALGLVTVSQEQINAGELQKTAEYVYNPNTLTLFLGGYLNYVASFLMVLSIPFMVMRKKFGYYMAIMATLASAFVSFDGFLVRDSFEWLVGGFMSLALFVVLILPVFKQFLVEEDEVVTN